MSRHLVILIISVCGATAFAVIVSLLFLDNLGSRSIRCDRNPSESVNCTLKNTHFLGLLSKTVVLPEVKQAILNTMTDTTDSGRTATTYGLRLQHKLGIQEVDSGLGISGSNAAKKNYEQIDAFLKS